MLTASQTRVWRVIAGGALTVAAALLGAVAVPIARAADDNALGVGLEYAAPVRYFQITGTNQNGQRVQTPVESVRASRTTPPYQWVWLVSPSELLYGSSAPGASHPPQWWWQGTLSIQTWSSYTSPADNVSSGATVCPPGSPEPSPQGSWRKCVYIVPTSPPPSSPPPPSPPPPSPPPPSPTPPAAPPSQQPAPPASTGTSTASSAVRAEYTKVLLAEFFGPARAVCSQLTSKGVHAYTHGVSSCGKVFAADQRALKLKLAATRWPAVVEAAVARLRVTIHGRRATAVDPSGLFRRTELVKVRKVWRFAGAPPLPRITRL